MIYDKIENLDKYAALLPHADDIKKTVASLEALKPGKNVIDGDDFYLNRVSTKSAEKQSTFEAHKAYIDIHFVISGREKIKYVINYKNNPTYDASCDAALSATMDGDIGELILNPNEFCVFFPDEFHSVLNSINGEVCNIEKIIFKEKAD